MMDEKLIQAHMKNLKLTREEAIQLIMDDEAIDHGEKLFELTDEQKKNAKKATTTTGDKRKRSYTFKARERKPDAIKREIIATIANNLDRCCFDVEGDPNGTETCHLIHVVKPEKEITFKVGEDEYSITLTKHRKPKGE